MKIFSSLKQEIKELKNISLGGCVWLIISLVIILCFSLSSVYTLSDFLYLKLFGEKTVGMVITLDKDNRNATRYTIKFQDKYKKEHTTENSSSYDDDNRWQVGDKVDILYSADNPSHSIMNNLYEGLFSPIIFLVISFLVYKLFLPVYKGFP
ncbi:MAG: hypothetical protein EAZ97_02615 [Bacteroidetes bacterium]|nr:MAG: hypothetical protein EAZ97_02615 [Bacteroidota bacterium]